MIMPNRQNKSRQKIVSRVFTVWFAGWFAILSATSHPVIAQSATADFESPVIDHQLIESSTWGDAQVFEASVVDNNRVARVRLFYRFAGELEYTEVEMQQLASSSSYTATVETGDIDPPKKAIEYFIRAEDDSENLVLQGFAFEPLVRTLVVDTSLDDAPTTPTFSLETTETATPEPEKKGVNWLYVALGVLVVGGIAAGAGGGDDDDVVLSDGECEPSCTVTLNIPTP